MRRLIALGVGLAGLAATPASAEEQYFGYTYSAEMLGKGQTETELWVTDRRGKAEGQYDAQDYRIELEHGVTNRLSSLDISISPVTISVGSSQIFSAAIADLPSRVSRPSSI